MGEAFRSIRCSPALLGRVEPDLGQHRAAARDRVRGERDAVLAGPQRLPHDDERRPQRLARLEHLAGELDLGLAPDEVHGHARAELGQQLSAGPVGGRVERDDGAEAALGIDDLRRLGVLGQGHGARAQPGRRERAAEHAAAAARVGDEHQTRSPAATSRAIVATCTPRPRMSSTPAGAGAWSGATAAGSRAVAGRPSGTAPTARTSICTEAAPFHSLRDSR